MSDQTSKGHNPIDCPYPGHRISLKIDVTKINKDWLFTGRTGAKYLDLVMFATPDKIGEYGDAYVVNQSPSKEARAAGAKGAILGNAKVWAMQPRGGYAPAPAAAARPPAASAPPPAGAASDPDVPFLRVDNFAQ